MDGLDRIIDFIDEAEGLKSVERTAWTAAGRRESTAEHSWRLTLLAGLLLDRYPDLDGQKVLMLCLCHDLGERYDGDVSAALGADAGEKHCREREAVERLASLLPGGERDRILALWEEYDRGITPEARLVKALDKAETILQHNRGQNPPDFDYGFNLTYGAAYFQGDPLLERLRQRLDRDTQKRMEDSASPAGSD